MDVLERRKILGHGPSDIELTADHKSFLAHKAVLSDASEYFKRMFESQLGPQNEVELSIDYRSLHNYISFVYSDLRPKGDWDWNVGLYKFLNYTQTEWPSKDWDISQTPLGRTYLRYYIRDLEEIYNGEIPKEIIQKAARYITEFIDLSDFTPELIRTLTWSKHFKPPPEVRDRIYAHLVSHGYDYEQIKGVHAHWTPDLIQSIAKNKPLLVRLDYDPHCTWNGTLTHTYDPDGVRIAIMLPGLLSNIEKGDTIRILEYEASRDSKRVKVKRWEPVD